MSFFCECRLPSYRAGWKEEGRGEIKPWSPQSTLSKPASHGWQLLTWKSQQLYRVRSHRHQWGVCSGTVQCCRVTSRLWGQTKTQGKNRTLIDFYTWQMCNTHSPIAQHNPTGSHVKATGFAVVKRWNTVIGTSLPVSVRLDLLIYHYF